MPISLTSKPEVPAIATFTPKFTNPFSSLVEADHLRNSTAGTPAPKRAKRDHASTASTENADVQDNMDKSKVRDKGKGKVKVKVKEQVKQDQASRTGPMHPVAAPPDPGPSRTDHSGTSFVVKKELPGTGSEIQPKDKIILQFLINSGGKELLKADGMPAQYTVGSGNLITGLDEGLKGMKVGGERTFIIPSSVHGNFRGAVSDVVMCCKVVKVI
ncbi:hypothetical protein FPV67DRAFT_1678619 [Lyophyllum atratum]|nr:hypothetical protein FPV67DRAFT_1678619 [Lyophyllum atratum]